MKIYLDFNKQCISKVDNENVYEGDIFSNVFELLFFNYGTNENWFPTMSQLAPNGRAAGDFGSDPIEEDESHEYVEDDVTYLRYTFTMGEAWVNMVGRSQFFVWVNTANPFTRKCLGKVNVMINQSNNNYFISDPTFNPAVKGYIDTMFNQYETEINAVMENLGDGSPKFWATSLVIDTTTEDKGIAVATDTGHIWYWDLTQISTDKYVDTGMVYNDMSLYYTKTEVNNALASKVNTTDIVDNLTSTATNKPLSANQGKVLKDAVDARYTKTESDNTFAPKSTAITHTGSQLQDYSGNNIYPNIDGTIISKEVFNDEDLTLTYNSDWTKLANTKRWCINYNNLIPKGETFSLGMEGYYTTGGTLTIELWTVNGNTLTRVDTISYTTKAGTEYTFFNEPIISNYKNTTNYPLLVTVLNDAGVNHQYAQYSTGDAVYCFGDLVSSSLSLSNLQTISNIAIRIKLDYLNYTKAYISKEKSFVTVKKDGTGDFKTLTDAINTIVEGTPILLFEGIYEEELYIPSIEVNITGVDKSKCIIRSTDGRYAHPTLYIKSGVLKNLTIEAIYVSGTSEEIGTNNGAYAVHVENETSAYTTLEIDNCVLRSDFSAAAGIGMRIGSTLIIKDSILINNQVSGRGSYEANGGLGALYVHDSMGVQGASKVILMNNIFKSSLGTSICMFHVTDQDNNSVSVWCTNNTLKDSINGYSNSTLWDRNNGLDYFSIDIGYGNSNSLLNN